MLGKIIVLRVPEGMVAPENAVRNAFVEEGLQMFSQVDKELFIQIGQSARLVDLDAQACPPEQVNHEEDNYASGYNQALSDLAGGEG